MLPLARRGAPIEPQMQGTTYVFNVSSTLPGGWVLQPLQWYMRLARPKYSYAFEPSRERWIRNDHAPRNLDDRRNLPEPSGRVLMVARKAVDG